MGGGWGGTGDREGGRKVGGKCTGSRIPKPVAGSVRNREIPQHCTIYITIAEGKEAEVNRKGEGAEIKVKPEICTPSTITN